MIDPSIIMRGAERAQLQQQQNIESLGDLGGALGKLIYGRRVNQMQQLKSPEEQQAFANNSIYAPYLNKQLKADAAAKVKAEQDALKFKSDLNNTDAQAAERLANAGSTNQKTGASRHGATLDVWRAAATNPSYGKVMLNNLLNAGAITQEVFDGTNNQLSVLEGASPAQAKEIIDNQIQAMLDPKYKYADANTIANNETSIKTTGMNNATTMRGQDITAETADKNRAQQENQFQQTYTFNQQKQYFEQNKPIGFFVDIDGYRRAEFADGRSMREIGEDGQPIKVQVTNNPAATAQKEETQRLQRVDAVLPEIEKLLPKATNSYVGRGLDYLVRGFGGSNQGDIATDQLKTLSGQLVSLMPKMSGPQSDKDVAMYKEMAGNLSDPTKSVEARMAALGTIRDLNEKYKELNQQNNAGIRPPLFNSSSYVD